VTKYDGFVPSNEYFSKTVYSKDTDNYKVVRQGQFAYATIHLDEGSVDYLRGFEAGIISPMYTVFDVDERQVDHRFILSLFKLSARLGRFDALGNGGVNRRKSISFKTLSSFPLHLPPLPEQRRIAEILSSVDEAIAATQAIIAQTRTVKQGVLKRLLTKGIGHTRFKQTEIGEIPDAWEVHALPDLLREPVRNGYSPVCPSEPTGKWILGLSALTHDGFNPLGVKPAPLDDSRLDKATLEPGDIVISRSNTPERVGLVGLYNGEPMPCHYPDLMMRLRFDHQRIKAEFAAAWLSFLQAQGHFAEAASGTSSSMVKINRAILAEVAVPVPGLAEQREIVDRLAQVSAVEDHARHQGFVLQQTKSALMSDLLTGRKRVPMNELAAAE